MKRLWRHLSDNKSAILETLSGIGIMLLVVATIGGLVWFAWASGSSNESSSDSSSIDSGYDYGYDDYQEQEYQNYADEQAELENEAWEPADTTYDSDCDIKGNISYDTGEQIYHIPGDAYYDATEVNEAYGEQWFCSEEEAIDAGWRRAYN